MNCFIVLLGFAYIATAVVLADDLLVQLSDGKIRGHILKSANGNDYYAFQEIPYAAPPIDENRFQLPKKLSPWNGVLNTTKNTRVCYQQIGQYRNIEISEDCLYLNVYSPVKPAGNSDKVPVLIWIFGGAFIAGSGIYQTFGPKYIMDHGIVVVTFNHRVGPFGFGTTEDDVIPANIGLKDQRVVFEWVKENIHIFGGDASQVTIAGQSSGARSVSFHILGQQHNENVLFRAGIMQSGTADSLTAQTNARDKLFACGRILDENFTSNESTELLKVLQQAPAAAILDACGSATGTVIEKEGYFSYPPLQSWINGNLKKIPVMMGFTSEEYLMVGSEPNIRTIQSLDNYSVKLVPPLMNMSPDNRSIAGKLLMKVYTNTSFEEDIGAYTRWSSDVAMTNALCKHAKLVSSHIPVYLYQFSYKGRLGHGPEFIIPGAGRVSHGEDINYMWDGGSISELNTFPEKDRITLNRFVKMWTNFVKHRNPTPQNETLLDHLRWPRTDGRNLVYLDFNETLKLKTHPRQFRHVETILDKYMQPPLDYY